MGVKLRSCSDIFRLKNKKVVHGNKSQNRFSIKRLKNRTLGTKCMAKETAATKFPKKIYHDFDISTLKTPPGFLI